MSPVRQLTWPSLRAPPRWTVVEGRACCGQRSSRSPAARYGITCTRPPVRVVDEERALVLLPGDARAPARCARASSSEQSRASSKREVVVARASPSTSSRQYGSSLQASSARPPSRERSTRPNWSCQRADASSRSATRRQTWSSRWSRITARALGDHPLGLVLGDRERDVQRLRRDLHLLAGAGEVDVPFLDRVRQPADARDLDLDDVARLIGREFAGVPVRITSPGSSVISRQRSASW